MTNSPFGLEFLLDPDSTYDDFLIAGDWWEENGPEGGLESFLFRTLSRWRRRPTSSGLFYCLPSSGDEPTCREAHLPKEFWPLATDNGWRLVPTSIKSCASWFMDGYCRFLATQDYRLYALFEVALDLSSQPFPDWRWFWEIGDAALWPGNRVEADALSELAHRWYTPMTLASRSLERFFWEAQRDGGKRWYALPNSFFTEEELQSTPCWSPLMTLSECYRWYLRRYHELHKPALAASGGVIV